MPKLSMLTKEIKKYAKNRDISDEDFLNGFLSPLITVGDIRNKKKEIFYLDKRATSLILNGKKDVPVALRESLSKIGLEKQLIEGMEYFVSDYLAQYKLEKLKERLYYLIDRDAAIPEADKESMKTVPLKNLLAKLLLVSLIESNKGETLSNVIWKNGKNYVEVTTGDLFQYGFGNRKKTRNIIVIPVNTAFDTHVTRKLENDPTPLVSETTIHGEWLERIQKSGVGEDELYERITLSLQIQGVSELKIAGNPKGRQKVYPIGSIAIIESENSCYFLLAISDFDDSNVAHSTPQNINVAVKALLEKYNAIGQGYDLYLPILGTGRSRAGLSIEDAFSLLKESFLAHSDLVQGHIIVVVRPEDSNEIDFLKKGGETD